MIEIVSATKLSESEFWSKSALGISLRRLAKDTRLIARIAFENLRGLPVVFNESIEAQEDANVLVFIHDDVWIDDDTFADRVLEGLKSFDIIGIAGNRRRVKNQPSWAFIDEKLTWDNKNNLCGSVAHGKFPFGDVSTYGATPAECELLDGVFIAAEKSTLKAKGIRFDPRFDFHFYDLDFCRSARAKESRLGVWQIGLTHQSGGTFGSQPWWDKYRLYLDKWEIDKGRTATGNSDTITLFNFLPQAFQRFKKSFPSSRGVDQTCVATSPSNLFIPQVDLLGEYASYKKLGNEYLAKGDLDNAAECYGHMVAVNPKNAVSFLNLGFVLKEQKLYEAAEHYLKRAALINPAMEDVYYLLGGIAQVRGNLAGAVENYTKTLELKPDFEIAYGNLCHVLFQSGQIESAKKVIKQGLSLNPESAEFHCYLGNLYVSEKKFEKAISCYQNALSIQPDYAAVHSNMGKALMELGKIDEALEWYRKAVSLDSDSVSVEAKSCLLFAQNYYSQVSPTQYLAEVKHYGSIVLAQAKPYTSWPVNPTNSPARLRVGLVSGDLLEHPVGFFLESILTNLNPARIELLAYPTQLKEDDLTDRIKLRFSAWSPIAGLSDEAAAQKIHADGVHILIDLAGHTTHNRLPMFAWKPAPVQVSWLGYFASTGVPGIDFLLADKVSVPESHREYFTETIWYLPDTRLCFTPPASSARLALTPPPVVRNGYITFGCFQNVSKINDDVLVLWGKIFHILQQARLRIQNPQMNLPSAREDLLQRLARVGIAQQRVTIEGAMLREDYLAAHADVDINLDTFPYPGGTTTCEALWMGVPTLTLAGNTMLARQGASMLACAGLEDWIANSEKDYVALAIAHASDVNRLVQLRSGLRQKVFASPLFDAPLFAKRLEDALQDMWHHSHLSNPFVNYV